MLNVSILVKAVSLLTIAILVYLAYAPGLTGSLFYDDLANLKGLANVSDLSSAQEFVFGGNAGPFGRPISLATFVPHATDWPNNTSQILRVNVLLHIANGGLLFLLGYLILRVHGRTPAERSFYIAVSAAALWLVLPILASTSLIAVQRMTSLAAFFGLLGLIGFVWAYRFQMLSPNLAIIIQGTSLGLGSTLAILAKENALLIPVFALIIDQLVAPTPKRWGWQPCLRRGALWLSLLIVLLYLSPLIQNWPTVHPERGFTPLDRLLTQTVILWEYLRLTFLPNPLAFGPFHDHVIIIENYWASALAIVGFLLVVSVAFLYRHHSKLPLFALLWFFTGHLLESTVIPLELVFEHRNYLAVYGFCFLLAYAAWNAPTHLARLTRVGLAGYTVVLCAILFGTTTVWGKPLEAAENWASKAPNSPRAVLHLNKLQYQELDSPALALLLLDRSSKQCSRCIDVRMQALLYACRIGDPQIVRARVDELVALAPHGRGSSALLDGFYPLREFLSKDQCKPMSAHDGTRITQALLNNPAYFGKSFRVHTLFHAAAFAYDSGQARAAEDFLGEAESLGPATVPILEFQIYLLTQEGRYGEALAAIERRRALEPRARARAPYLTDTLLSTVENAVLAARREGGNTPGEMRPAQLGVVKE